MLRHSNTGKILFTQITSILRYISGYGLESSSKGKLCFTGISGPGYQNKDNEHLY
ncbi:hypothetical protein SAMN05216316_2946 [Nitrosovibrio sp. Nv6]|nr:hypothetical protein SAMN05216316_2946 [Nitrosovibrio sp. Nv6]